MSMIKTRNIDRSYQLAQDRYAGLGVATDKALKQLEGIPISLHCWQGDDVGGFENFGGTLGGGLVATGNYPGKARTPDELRADLEKTFSLIPGKHRLNLHAFYGEFGGKKVDRDQIDAGAFQKLDCVGADKTASALDFNPTCFSHPEGGRRLHPVASRTNASANSGSSIASAAAKSARPSARRSKKPASPTSGFPTA